MRYIWVDSLCILQDDAVEQQNYILHIDSIYGLTSITIIGALRNNSNAGLSIIRPNSQTHKKKPFTIREITLLQTLEPTSTSKQYIGICISYLV